MKAEKRGVGVSLNDLWEDSQFGRNARLEIVRWFPSSAWLARPPPSVLREEVELSRRQALLGMAGVAGVALPGVGCAVVAQALPLIFQALEAARKVYEISQASGGSAFFSNGSQSREKSQLLTSLLSGSPKESETQDEMEFLVDVPGRESDYAYAFEGLVSDVFGDHFFSGLAAGTTVLSEIFSYVS